MNKFLQGPLLIIIAAALWAFDGVLRRSLFSLPPTHIIFFEHLQILFFKIIFKKRLGSFSCCFSSFRSYRNTLFYKSALDDWFYIFFCCFFASKITTIFCAHYCSNILERKNRNKIRSLVYSSSCRWILCNI